MDFDGFLLTLRRRWAVAAVATLAAFLGFAATIPSIPRKYRAECKVFCTEPLAGGFETLKSLGVLDGLGLQNLLPLLGSRELAERVRSHLHRTGDAGGWMAEDLVKGLEVKRIGGTGYVQLTLSGARAGIFRALNILVEEAALLWRERIRSEAAAAARDLESRVLASDQAARGRRAALEETWDELNVRCEEAVKALFRWIQIESLGRLAGGGRASLQDNGARLSPLQAVGQKYLELLRALAATQRLRAQLDQASAELRILETADRRPLVAFERAAGAERLGRGPLQLYILAAGLAVIIGLVLAVVREKLDDAIHTSRDLRRRAGLPALSLVPELEPHDRALTLARQLLARGEGLRTVLLAGVEKRIGKSSLAVDLGRAAARLGRRAAVVDADASDPRVHHLLGGQNRQGLTDILAGDLDALRRLGSLASRGAYRGGLLRGFPGAPERRASGAGEDLLVIPAGPPRSNFAQLLESPALEILLGELAATRDLVIIDSAPLSVSSEALSLARRVDGVILVAGRGRTRSRALLWARKAIGQAGGKVVGAVLNGGPQPRRGDSIPLHDSEWSSVQATEKAMNT